MAEWEQVTGLHHMEQVLDGWTFRGNWVWEVFPYQSPNWPGHPETWILRGRQPGRVQWRYMGGYSERQGAQDDAERYDTAEPGTWHFRRYYPDDRPDEYTVDVEV